MGFQHEHQRKDAKQYLQFPDNNCEDDPDHSDETDHSDDPDYEVRYDYIPLTAFDPYSIMLYEEQEHEGFCRLNSHEIWQTKEDDTSENTRLSELDKVGLNLVYPPCIGKHYNPEKDEETEMYYCGRKVMERHNIPYDNIVYRCERGGPNCPACRTLGKPKGSDNK